jgi:two-component system sensor histidine kinase BaeS
LFANLLENACRYTDAGGRCEIALAPSGGMAVAEIRDSAPGVPEEALARLFERFYRVDASRSREHGGAGLGLAICQNIVEAHGGRIAAAASPLGGLSVRVEIPLLPA